MFCAECAIISANIPLKFDKAGVACLIFCLRVVLLRVIVHKPMNFQMSVPEKWGESQQTERNDKAAQSAHVYCDLRGVFVLVLSTDFACGDW